MVIIFPYVPVNALTLSSFDGLNFDFLTGNHQKHYPLKFCAIQYMYLYMCTSRFICLCMCICMLCVCNVCTSVCSFAYVILLLVDHSAREEQVTVAESTCVGSYKY